MISLLASLGRGGLTSLVQETQIRMSDGKVYDLSELEVCAKEAATALSGSDRFATLWRAKPFQAFCVSAGFANLALWFDSVVNLIAVAARATIPFLIAPLGVKPAHGLNATDAESAIAAPPIATTAFVLYNTQTG